MHKKALLAFTALFMFGMYLLGTGITGMYLLDFKQPPCNENADCTGFQETCCYFHNEKFGVCDIEDNCAAIDKATFEAGKKITSYNTPVESAAITQSDMVRSHIEGPSGYNPLYSALAGVFLMLIAILGFFIGKARDIYLHRSRSLYRHH